MLKINCKMKFTKCLFIPFFFLLVLSGCKTDPANNNGDAFDRQAMLENLANNIIVPAYEEYAIAADSLEIAFTAFESAPGPLTLPELRNKLLSAYNTWQRVAHLNFGPADDIQLLANTNVYPTDTATILSNIANGQWDLSQAGNLDAKGFPALDYLLFLGTEMQVGSTLMDANRRAYLKDLITEIAANANTVYNAWNPSGGNYANTFSTNDGTDVGSSLGLLINSLNQYFERDYRDGKIGIPSGIRGFSGTTLPTHAEATFFGMSGYPHVNTGLLNMRDLVLGIGVDATEGLGLDDHLDAVDAQFNGEKLSSAIRNQFAAIQTELGAASQNGFTLKEAIDNDPQTLQAVYDEMQKMIVLLKSDLPSSLGVLITYTDNDGD